MWQKEGLGSLLGRPPQGHSGERQVLPSGGEPPGVQTAPPRTRPENSRGRCLHESVPVSRHPSRKQENPPCTSSGEGP